MTKHLINKKIDMNTSIRFLIIILLIGCISCEKNESNLIKETTIINVSDKAIKYLSDKAILSIQIYGKSIWILSSKYCDTCYVAPHISFRPIISQLTLIKNSSFEYEEPTSVGMPCMNHKGILFTASGNKVYKINNIKDYELVLETGDFHFNSMAFDQNDNIWFSGYNGIAFWDGNVLKVYNKSNSELPTDIIHGLAIDNSGNVWATLDFKGLLKISGDEWEIIPNSEISGLNEYSYLYYPIVDNENNIWFGVISPDTNSNILVFDTKEWSYQYPNQFGYGIINIDLKGTIWIINSEYENHTFKKSTLTYLINNEWIDFDVSMIESKILTINADDEHVFIGTVNGLVIVDK